jgi:signal peptidase I
VSALIETEAVSTSKVRSFPASPTATANLVLTLALIASWFFLLAPQFLGGPIAYVLVSGESMEPTLHDNDFVIARRQDTYENGDIVVYRIPKSEIGAGGLVIHRIIGGSDEGGYILQGDNRTTPDLWRPRSTDVAGRLLVTIPKAGELIPYLRSPLLVAAFAGYMAFLFVYLGGKDLEPSDEDTGAGGRSRSLSKRPG